jgi:Acetyltransferase (GNAT) domain
MQLPVMTRQLAQRIQRVLKSLQISSTLQAQQQPGNPCGIQIQRFGNATAHMATAITTADWCNRVVGFDDEGIEHLDEIRAFFQQQHLRFNIDMNPTTFTPELSRRLTENGFYPIPNGVVLYGLPQTSGDKPPEGVEVREVPKAEVDLVADLWADGFELPPRADREAIKSVRKGAFAVPDNHLYVAYVDGVPVAMAALYIQDAIGYLNVGATLPAFRKRGCHSALTARRIMDAAEAGCELLMGYIGTFGSVSQNNMERGGMQIAYATMAWVER